MAFTSDNNPDSNLFAVQANLKTFIKTGIKNRRHAARLRARGGSTRPGWSCEAPTLTAKLE